MIRDENENESKVHSRRQRMNDLGWILVELKIEGEDREVVGVDADATFVSPAKFTQLAGLALLRAPSTFEITHLEVLSFPRGSSIVRPMLLTIPRAPSRSFRGMHHPLLSIEY